MDFLQKYRQRLMYLGEKVTVSGVGFKFYATPFDIDEVGRLLVRTETNEIQAITAGEISIRAVKIGLCHPSQ